MKAFLPSLLILAAIVSAAALNCGIIARKTVLWDEKISQSEVQAQAGDWSSAEKLLKKMQKSWENSRTYLRITIRHEELDSVETLCSRAAVAADQRERADFLGETAELRSRLRLLSEMEQFKLGSIF